MMKFNESKVNGYDFCFYSITKKKINNRNHVYSSNESLKSYRIVFTFLYASHTERSFRSVHLKSISNMFLISIY